MADNPLVAAPVDTATPFSGAGIVSDGADLVSAIQSGDWVAGGMAAFSAAIDTAATLSDPIGSLIAAGLGWLMDHIEPLKGWLNDLTGDAGEVQAFSQTWSNIAQQLTMAGQELQRVVNDIQTQSGEAMDAYRRFQQDAGQHIDTAGTLASAFSTGLGIAGTIVQVVHDLVRDAIAQIVGSAISWAAEAVFSLGLATPWIIEQVSTRVSALVSKIGTKLTDLLKSVKELKSLLSKVEEILQKLKGIFDKVLHGGPKAPTHGTDLVPVTATRNPWTPAAPGERLNDWELDAMAQNGYHTSIFDQQVAGFYDRDGATLGATRTPDMTKDPLVWATPTEDVVAHVHTPWDAAVQTGHAPRPLAAAQNGGDVYAVHFPVDEGALRRPVLEDATDAASGYTNPHFYEDPTSADPTYGHTAINTGSGYMVNPSRETVMVGGHPVPSGSVLTKLENGGWTVIRRY